LTDLAASLLIAALASALTFLFQSTRRRLRERQLRRKYPAAGLFATEFEDQENGRPIIVKGLTRLTQRGLDVRGVTSELQSGRCWDLEGRISPGGFLSGIYTAEDPHDTGSGTFFVEIDGASGDMHGLWAGYDSVNHSVEGGGYTFRRCPEAAIRPAGHDEAPAIVGLLGDALGDRYIELKDVTDLVASDGEQACFVARNGSHDVAGALLTKVLDHQDLTGVFPSGQEGLLNELPLGQYHDRVGFVRAIAVSEGYRGRGIATQLTRTSLDWLIEQQATLALSFGWKSPDGCHVQGVLESCGFTVVGEIDHFWREDSKSAGYSCPTCGDVCTCSAVVFTRSLLDMPATRCRL
jgi:ribosomal protein S18 acetylase RimI-like enzyme